MLSTSARTATPIRRPRRPCGCPRTCWHQFAEPVTQDQCPGAATVPAQD